VGNVVVGIETVLAFEVAPGGYVEIDDRWVRTGLSTFCIIKRKRGHVLDCAKHREIRPKDLKVNKL
jgi:hypothetical protein